MNNFVIITDSAADLPIDFINDNNLIRCPLNYIVDGKEYGINLGELTKDEFYAAMNEGKDVSTSAAVPSEIISTMTKQAEAGKDILYISFSSALSSSYSNTVLAANTVMEDFPNISIKVIDSLAVTAGLSIIVRNAVLMKNEGKSMDEIVDWLENNKTKFIQQFVISDLFFLLHGGRLSKSSAIIGTALKLNPIICVNKEGALETIAKARGRKRAMSILLENMDNNVNKESFNTVYITHANCEDYANELSQKIKEKFEISDIIIQDMSPTIAVHGGPGALFISYLGK